MSAIVYLATNKVNGKRYIGATGRSLSARRRQHELSTKKYMHCPRFHAAMRKHGAGSFEWMVVAERATFQDALQEEMRLIAEIKPEYNLTAGGEGARGRTASKDLRAKLSASRKGIVFSAEHLANLSSSHKGKKQSAETIAKRAAGQTGKPLSQEHREKIRATLSGRKRPPEIIAKMRAGLLKYQEAMRQGNPS